MILLYVYLIEAIEPEHSNPRSLILEIMKKKLEMEFNNGNVWNYQLYANLNITL